MGPKRGRGEQFSGGLGKVGREFKDSSGRRLEYEKSNF